MVNVWTKRCVESPLSDVLISMRHVMMNQYVMFRIPPSLSLWCDELKCDVFNLLLSWWICLDLMNQSVLVLPSLYMWCDVMSQSVMWMNDVRCVYLSLSQCMGLGANMVLELPMATMRALGSGVGRPGIGMDSTDVFLSCENRYHCQVTSLQ